MTKEMKNRFRNLYKQLVRICEEAPAEVECTPEENDLYEEVWCLRSTIYCSGLLED